MANEISLFDGLHSGLAFKAPCKSASTVNITLSGEQTINGVSCVSGDRVLVKGQSDTRLNGIYTVSTGLWSRPPDADGNRDFRNGTLVYVTSGSQNGTHRLSCTEPVTIGTTSLSFFTTDIINSQTISVVDFGAVGDGVTDDTAAIQACFDYCRDNDAPWVVPAGSYLVTGVIAYTSGVCNGEFLFENAPPNTYAVSVAPDPADVQTLSLATMNAMTGWTKGSDFSPELAPYYGHTVYFFTNDELSIKRTNGDDVEWSESIVVHGEDGSFSPPLTRAKGAVWASAVMRATRNRHRIVIEGLRVRSVSGAGEVAGLVYVTRPNTTLHSPSCINVSGNPIQQGVVIDQCSGVIVVAGTIEGLQDNATNYGYNVGSACFTTLIDCAEVNCRRGLDSTHSKQTAIIGGHFPDGIGAHWAHGLSASGAFLSSSPSNTAPVHVAGGDVAVRDCKIRVRSDQYSVVKVRADTQELEGSVTIDGNIIEFDCSANTGTARNILNATTTATTFEWGRQVLMPRQVSICGNRVRQVGAGFTSNLLLALIVETTFAPPSGVSVGGDIKIAGNSFELDATALVGGQPRLRVTINKMDAVSGDGYRIDVSDLPSLQMRLFCSSTHGTPSAARHTFYCRNIGSLAWSANYGAFVLSEYRAKSITSTARPGGGYATPVGDEVELRVGHLLGVATWNPPSLADGAAASTTVTVTGCVVGEVAMASMGGLTVGGWVLSAYTSAADTVTVTLLNKTGGVLDVGSGALRVRVIQG